MWWVRSPRPLAKHSWSAYGAVDERTLLLDAPIASLHALRRSVRLPRIPPWGEKVVHEVESGAFHEGLRRALGAL